MKYYIRLALVTYGPFNSVLDALNFKDHMVKSIKRYTIIRTGAWDD